MNKLIAALVLAALAFVAAPAGAGEIRAVNKLSYFPEGPVWFEGKLYYVEYGKDRVMVWDGKTNEVVWTQKGCGANGLAINPDKTFWVACNAGNTIAKIDLAGHTLETRSADGAGKPFNGPNDFGSDGRGGIYFTTSGDYDLAKPIDGRVYYISPKIETITRVADNLWFANGVVVVDDGQSLLVAETLSHRVLRFAVNKDGTLGARYIFARMQDLAPSPIEDNILLGGPDSMRVDSKGNVYIAQYGASRILVADRIGKLIRILAVPMPYVTNCAFSPDEQTIYITATQDQDNSPFPGAVFELDNK
jgi:gluconolactonase